MGNEVSQDVKATAPKTFKYRQTKKSMAWSQNVKKNGAPSQDSERAQNVEYYNVWECDPADNTNTAGSNDFCTSKDSSKPYCDPNLKKCYGCSIVNNDPSGTSGAPNQNDCGVAGDEVTIGKCNLASGAEKGGIQRMELESSHIIWVERYCSCYNAVRTTYKIHILN
ncbi:MAG: hypothetical protein HY051_00680 [Candidatus Aenigmarchaeota archaeon]|nr:hypothetical protein [Candidatus Aenigmarchaeota archaeon]